MREREVHVGSAFRAGTHYLVVSSLPESGHGLRGARVSTAGVVLDPGGFPIAPYDPDHDVSDPAIAWNGSACLVVWQGPDPAEPTVTAMRRALVTPAGAVLDPGASGVAASLAPLDLAFDGQGFLLTGHTIDAATQDALVWGVRLGPDLRRRAR